MAFRRSRVRSPSAPPTSAFPQFVRRHPVERLEVAKRGHLHAGRETLERPGSSPERSSEPDRCARGFTCAAVLGEDTDVVVMTVLVRNQSGEGIIEAQSA